MKGCETHMSVCVEGGMGGGGGGGGGGAAVLLLYGRTDVWLE